MALDDFFRFRNAVGIADTLQTAFPHFQAAARRITASGYPPHASQPAQCAGNKACNPSASSRLHAA